MVVFDAKLDYVLKDLLEVPIDTETNPTRIAFEEEAIYSWSKFINLPASFIDGLRYFENNIPKYPAKSIIMELQSIRNYRRHLIKSNDANANNPPSWDILLYTNWVAYDEQSFLAGTTAVTTTTFNSNSGVTTLTKMVNDDIRIEEESSISEGAKATEAASAIITQLDFPDENKKRTMVAATVRTTVVDGKGIPVENTPPRPPPPSNACIENNYTEDSGARPLNQEAEATASASTKRTMVTTTAVDSEVIPVENTPPRPPPLPEPPPPSNNFTENNNEDSQQGLHSISSTDGEIIRMIKVLVLLLRSMYQIQVREDNDDNDDDDTIADVHKEDETIAIVMQLVALYQVKYKTVPTLFHDAFNNYIQDTNFVNSNILSMTKFYQQHNFVSDKIFADPDDILSMTKFCQQHNFVNDKHFADADDIFYDCCDPNDFIKDIHIDRTSIEPYNNWRTIDDSTTSLIHQGIQDNCATYNFKAGELGTALHPIYGIEVPKNSYDNCHAIAPEGTTISGELIMSFRLSYQVDRMYCTIAAITLLLFLHQDIHENDDNDTIAMIMQLVVLFQLKYKMRSFVREDDDTIADVHDSKYNSNLYIDNRCWYSTTPTDEEILSFRLIYQVQVQGQAKYEMIRPIHLICSNDNGNFSTSIDGEKYTSQPKYKDDNTIAIMQLVVLHQDVHEADNTITFMQKALFQDTHINDETIAIMQLVVLYAVVPYHQISYRMKITPTTEDSSSTDNKKTEDQINSNTATIDIYDNDDTIANMQLVALYHDKDVVHNIDSIFNCPFDIINGNAKFSTSINGQKYTSQDYYIKEYETMNDNGTYCNDTRKNGERTTHYSNEDPYMIQYHDITTAIDATYDCNSNDTTITTSITYYCTEQIWMIINNNYNNIRFNDGNHCNYIMKKNGEKKRLEEKYQSRALRSEGQYKDEVYNAEEGMFQEPITTKDSSYLNITNIVINFHNDKEKENGEQTTCYSNQDPCMIIAIDSKDNIDMIATDASLRLGHSNEGKIDINTSFNTIRDETATLIRTATRTSIGDETTTLTSTDQNGENSERLDYNLVIVLIYDYIISMILVQLCSCILLIVTMRLMSQSMGSVKIHKDQVLKLI